MNSPVIAIGLDAMDPQLLERWVAQGALPNLARLFNEGSYARQSNTSLYRVENSWLTLLHGCTPDQSNEWGHQDYVAGDYTVNERASYGFRQLPPFYALGKRRRVAVFDVPLTHMVPDVDGVQLLGWGTEVNQILRQSSPPDLMAELIARHGRHPLYDTITNADDGSETLSYRIPSVYDMATMRAIKDKLVRAVHQRTAILRDLAGRERWDLFMGVYAEIHTAGHLFWHLGEEHLLNKGSEADSGADFMLDIAQAIDEGVGALVKNLPPDAQLFVFSPHGMQGNSLDLYSMLFLPELLYRWNFGQAALAQGDANAPLPRGREDYSRHWREEVWDLRTPHGNEVLESPYEQEQRRDPLDWDPGNWYRKRWPAMRAFVLPGYSEGLIRINVAGRDGAQGIPANEFGRVCDELEQMLAGLTDARTGKPMIQDIVRVRAAPEADAKQLSAADLMVLWRDDIATDAAEHPVHGRIGPAPFFRTGGHTTEGFVLARGAGFAPGVRLPP
ncbi:MAG TPA: alkaline phosphatase family protein, partial [Ramlibacter sp.]|nr:alkaline phosphatase family protein [Ramlibacter sp.]